MLSDLLVSAIYKLCLKSSTMPHILHSPTASLLPLWPIQNSFHLKDYIPSPQIFFQGFLPLSFQLLLFNLLPYAYFYMLLSFVFMQSFHSSSMKKSLITLHLNCSLKHWSSLKFLCRLLPEENSTYKQACFKTSLLLPQRSCVQAVTYFLTSASRQSQSFFMLSVKCIQSHCTMKYMKSLF